MSFAIDFFLNEKTVLWRLKRQTDTEEKLRNS